MNSSLHDVCVSQILDNGGGATKTNKQTNKTVYVSECILYLHGYSCSTHNVTMHGKAGTAILDPLPNICTDKQTETVHVR